MIELNKFGNSKSNYTLIAEIKECINNLQSGSQSSESPLYTDTGTVRIQGGTGNSTIDGTEQFTFPVPFKEGTTPIVTITRTVLQQNVSSTLALYGPASNTGFSINRDNAIDGSNETFNWIAMGIIE